ncbi:MAG TPA: ABC transporter permease [Christensenellaceae bacterium]|jgi:spermidine/putrescine transport system permease protein|nr:ABC transporter permease [Christensenellaceae bacterium]
MKKNTPLSKLYITFTMLLLYLPILVVVLFSFNANTGRTASMSFTGFSTYWYKDLLSPVTGFGTQLKSSLEVAFWSVFIAAVLAILGAIGMVRRKMGKSLASKITYKAIGAGEQLAMLPMMIPELIMGISLMALFRLFKLPFGKTTLILSHITFCVPYILVTVKSRLITLDPSLVEAARDLGASPFKAIITVTLPLVAPAILSGSLLAFAMSMDDFVISFFVSGAETTTLPLKIYSSVKVGVTPKVNAMCTVMLGFAFLMVGGGQLVSAYAERRKEIS